MGCLITEELSVNILSAVVMPPSGGFIDGIVYGLVGWLVGLIGSYGVAILLFSLVLKLVTLPLDFGNKYFSKKNTIKMAELNPEIEKLKSQYANDPIALNRERSNLYKKHGYSQGGFCLFTLLSLGLTLFIFISVYGALNNISNYNVMVQYDRLEETYIACQADPSRDVNAELKSTYDKNSAGFLWVKNIWRPDSFVGQTLSFDEFRNATAKLPDSIFWTADGKAIEKGSEDDKVLRETYDKIFTPIKDAHQGLNGWLLLVLLAGASTFFSTMINNKITAKKKEEKAEEVVQYSMRSTKATAGGEQQKMPQMDPAQMGNIMKFVMPVIMIGFAISTTSAMALYIIANSIFSTLFAIGINFVIDKIIFAQKTKEKQIEDIPINPHAKYFRSARKKEK